MKGMGSGVPGHVAQKPEVTPEMRPTSKQNPPHREGIYLPRGPATEGEALELPLSPLALARRGFDLYPHRAAVIDENGILTYRELKRRIERLAGGLRAQGVGPGDRVALLAPNTAHAFECYTGVPLSGGVLVPLNIRLSGEDYAYILRHSGSRTLIVDQTLLSRVEGVLPSFPEIRVIVSGEKTPPYPSYDLLLETGDPVPFSAEGMDERDILSINYTSGTTARPKGVMQTHRNNHLNAINMILVTGLRPEDVHLHVAPMFHANGWGFVWATLAVGAANVMLPKVDSEDIFHKMKSHRVTIFCASQTVLTRLLESGPPSHLDQSVRLVTAGAAPPAEVIRRLEGEFGWHVTHLYGLTETTAFLTMCEEPPFLKSLSDRDRSTFKARQGLVLPLSGEVRVVRPDLTEVQRDAMEMGEVVARGNVIMSGYYRDEAATADALQGGWFHTGDLAVWHPDGYVELKDRKKDIIISGGENISSLEVEGVLYRHPAISQAAVVAGPHPTWGETPVAFVVLRSRQRVLEDDLIAFCRDNLTHFKAPTRVVFLEDLPRTASGKIQKYLLREMLKPGPQASGP